MELGIFEILEFILGFYFNVVIVWIGVIVVDLIINKFLKFSFFYIEFKCVYFYNINFVGFGLMVIVFVIVIIVFVGLFGLLL